MAGLYSFDACEDNAGTSVWCRSDTRDEAEVEADLFALNDVNL